MSELRLGVNIDHVATVRNARGGDNPDPVRAAMIAQMAGASGITAHLREDRRHIVDNDIERLIKEIKLPLNFEMAATEEMVSIARRVKPYAACIVPEKREEVTTEGGLDVVGQKASLEKHIGRLGEAEIRVSLFVDPEEAQIRAAKELQVPVIELHTGAYCEARGEERERELNKIKEAAALAGELGIECHAGHGLTFATVAGVAAIPTIKELNIGHFLIGEAVFLGLDGAIKKMRTLMDEARGSRVEVA